MNNKGAGDVAGGFWLLLIMAVVLLAVIVAFYVMSLASPIISTTITDTKNLVAEAAIGDNNMSSAVNATVVPTAEATTGVMDWFAYILLIFTFIVYLFMAYYVKTYPFLIVFWIILIIALSVVSFFMTSSYMDLSSGSDSLATAYRASTTNDYMMRYLPHIFITFGLVGGFILFVLAPKESEGGGI